MRLYLAGCDRLESRACALHVGAQCALSVMRAHGPPARPPKLSYLGVSAFPCSSEFVRSVLKRVQNVPKALLLRGVFKAFAAYLPLLTPPARGAPARVPRRVCTSSAGWAGARPKSGLSRRCSEFEFAAPQRATVGAT
eukprot:358075-Chlamydomonas_euryale.AAC.3